MAEKSRKAWGGRFDGETDKLMEAFNSSLSFDRRLWREDIEGSKAYAEALARAGVIDSGECEQLTEGLSRVAQEIESGEFDWRDEDEDIHMAVERRLSELAGPVGGKLHTGRSRNDQVATDMRLWLMRAVDTVLDDLKSLQRALHGRAETQTRAMMPGFTHLQPAQVVSLAHYLMSFFWMLQRDRERFRQLRSRASVLPLGSGALAGQALGVDREFLARRLGFERVSPNSMDAVADRDFVAEFLSLAAIAMSHLSRLAEDLIIYSGPGCGFVVLSDAYSTGSSLMPQKKNPDSLELVRGKAGRVIGRLAGLLATLKGLPSTYNKDLQEDKEPLFDCYDTLTASLRITAGVVVTLEVNGEKMAAALDDFLLATDLADYLVARGLPFRESHRVVGRLVRECEKTGLGLKDLPLETYTRESGLFGPEIREVLDFASSLAARGSYGGTAPGAVQAQLEEARRLLE
ncbi:MAG: argininosuccinate lyase [Candidatus Glassbacteria bacterium]|nr:argininosuccinate lyase [Candidatus Glassbacteria bacterium]